MMHQQFLFSDFPTRRINTITFIADFHPNLLPGTASGTSGHDYSKNSTLPCTGTETGTSGPNYSVLPGTSGSSNLLPGHESSDSSSNPVLTGHEGPDSSNGMSNLSNNVAVINTSYSLIREEEDLINQSIQDVTKTSEKSKFKRNLYSRSKRVSHPDQ